MTRRRGSILVLVMFVLIVLSLLALSLAYRAGLETRSSRHRAARAQLRSHAASVVAIAAARAADNAQPFDHLFQPWHTHEPLSREGWLAEWSEGPSGAPAAFVVDHQTIDEEGKLHVRHASGNALEKLGMSSEQAAALFDWMDEDENVRAGGAESDFYRAREHPHRCKNAPLECLDELLMVRGFGPSSYVGTDATHTRRAPPGLLRTNAGPSGRPVLGWVDLLTCVGDGKVNINTAPWAVLETLPLSDGAAEQIVKFREFDAGSAGQLEEHVFKSAEDIDQLQGLTTSDKAALRAVARFKSQHYRVFAQAAHLPTGLRHSVEVLVRVEPPQARVIQWRVVP